MLDLTTFCMFGDDGERGLNRAFTRGLLTYATDGHVLVRVHRRDGIEERAPVPVETICVLMTGAERALPITGLDRLTFARCGGCDGKGRVVFCDECKGGGSVDCPTCRHDHVCEDCNGDGYVSIQDWDLTELPETVICPICQGQKRATEDKCAELAPGRWFNPKYLLLLASLPGCRIAHPDNSVGPSYFIFDGGEGLLLPMRGSGNEPKLYDAPAQAEAA